MYCPCIVFRAKPHEDRGKESDSMNKWSLALRMLWRSSKSEACGDEEKLRRNDGETFKAEHEHHPSKPALVL